MFCLEFFVNDLIETIQNAVDLFLFQSTLAGNRFDKFSFLIRFPGMESSLGMFTYFPRSWGLKADVTVLCIVKRTSYFAGYG